MTLLKGEQVDKHEQPGQWGNNSMVVPYRAQKVPEGLWQIVAQCLTGEFWGNDVHPFCKGGSLNILFALNYTDKQSCFHVFIFSDATHKMHK